MIQYKFRGQSNSGQVVTGQIEASSASYVANQLLSQGVTPIKIQEVPLTESYVKKINILLGAQKVFPVDLIMFCRQMYTINKAGIPLTRGIRGLASSIKHEHFREALLDIVTRLEAGNSLSVAMKAYPKIFNDLFVSMINVGESSGKLEDVFKQIGFYIERDEETKKRIKSAMRYPSFVTLALVAAVTIINIWVIPAFAQMFEKFNAELPLVTKVLIGMSDIFVNYWGIMLICVFLSGFAFYHYVRTPQGAWQWGKYKLKLPIVGDLIIRASMSRYSRSLSLMLRAGVPITKSLNLCAAAIDNPFLERKIINIREGIERGESLIHTHAQSQMFTALVLQMIAVGEESGQIEELLSDVAGFYEREVDYDLKTLTDRIEPILIFVMAIFVTILALGIFLPMWSIYEIRG